MYDVDLIERSSFSRTCSFFFKRMITKFTLTIILTIDLFCVQRIVQNNFFVLFLHRYERQNCLKLSLERVDPILIIIYNGLDLLPITNYVRLIGDCSTQCMQLISSEFLWLLDLLFDFFELFGDGISLT